MPQTTDLAAYLSVLESTPDPQRRVTVLRLWNTATQAMDIWLEPMGDRLPLAANAHFDVVAHGPVGDATHGDVLTIQWDEGTVKVWISSDTEALRIFQNGSLVWEAD